MNEHEIHWFSQEIACELIGDTPFTKNNQLEIGVCNGGENGGEVRRAGGTGEA